MRVKSLAGIAACLLALGAAAAYSPALAHASTTSAASAPAASAPAASAPAASAPAASAPAASASAARYGPDGPITCCS
jgi:hypothetical protein